jgi:hypothetical protein
MDAPDRLRHVVPASTTWVRVPSTRTERAETADRLRRMPPGTTIVLADPRPGSRRRSRVLARRSGVRIERELLAIPSVETPVYAVEDVAPAVASFWNSFVTVPAGVTASALPVTLAIRLVAVLRAWGLIGAIVPGRVTVGRRS